METDKESYIYSQKMFIETNIKKQQTKKRYLKIFMYFLITISCISSTIIPIIEILRPMSIATIMSSIFAVCNTASVGLLTKFNLSKKSKNVLKILFNYIIININ